MPPRDDLQGALVEALDLALVVLVEELAVVGELVQVLAAVEPVGERGVVRVEHVRADLEAHEVEQRRRRHRQAERRDRLVDGLERGALVDRAHRLAEEHGEQAVDHEAGGVGGDDRVLLAGSSRVTIAVRERRVIGVRRLHDLDQRHDRDRGEEVEAHEALGVRELRADLLDRERRGVRGEDGLGGDELLDLGEDVLLDLELLEDGLDDPVAVGEVGLVGGAA